MRRIWIGGLVLFGIGPVALAQAGVCFRSPEDVVRGGARSGAPDSGYRLQSTRWDAQLGRGWATVLSCDHPERPAMTVALVDAAPKLSPGAAVGGVVAGLSGPSAGVVLRPVNAGPPVVRAGEAVRIFRRDDVALIEFSGIAQANGNPGDVIRVRVKHAVSDEAVADQYIAGTVRGPRLLEMQP